MALRLGLISVSLLIVAVLLYSAYQYWNGNFHTVIRGRLYRSAQPDAAQLQRWHARVGFRTILNLRGAHPDWAVYRAETAFADANGVTLVDYPIRAARRLRAAQIDELLAILQHAEEPILVHCHSGSDRSALVSALFATTARRSAVFALWQFSPWYGHWSLPFLKGYAMDATFAAFRKRRRTDL